MRMNCGENTIAGPVFKIASDKRELLEIKNNEIIHRKPINNHLQGNAMAIHNSLSELIGNTPLVKLSHVTDGIKATIAVKVEYFNPGGSSKDRIAERIIDAAERSGELKPGGVIVEPTSGNTGVGLALVAQQRGYRTIFTLPDKVSEAKRAVLRAYGAEVVVTPTDAGPDDPRSYYQVAERLAKAIPGGYRPNQYDNPNGPESHYHTTGPEIWEASDHQVTHFVAGIGTGGTISGTGRYLKEASDGKVQVVGADPEGSIYSNPDDVHQYSIEGVGEDFYPKAFDRELPDEIVQVNDAEAFEMTRRLAAEEGLLVGGSSGMAVMAALKYAREHDLDENQLAHIRSKEIGFIFQQFQLLPRLDALKNVELPLIYAGVPPRERTRRAEEMLVRVGLKDRMHHYQNQLSGGQQQRVAIARALATNPTLLLADEPTGALDQATGEQVMALFRELNDEGRTIVMITHDLKIARHASRIVNILDGVLSEGVSAYD